MYNIENNIPIPENRKQGLTEIIKALKIGDSFIMPLDERAKAVPTAKQIGYKVMTRKISDTEARIWRIE